MNLAELRDKLPELGIRLRSYSLDGRDQADRYCLERSGGGWAVFYAERGERMDERWFEDEAEACEHLLQMILGDPTTRAR